MTPAIETSAVNTEQLQNTTTTAASVNTEQLQNTTVNTTTTAAAAGSTIPTNTTKAESVTDIGNVTTITTESGNSEVSTEAVTSPPAVEDGTEATNVTAGQAFLVSEGSEEEAVHTSVNIHETLTEELALDAHQSEYSVDAPQSDNVNDLQHISTNTPSHRKDLISNSISDDSTHQEDDVTASVLDLLSVEYDTTTEIVNDYNSLETNSEFEDLELGGKLDTDTVQRQEYAKSRSLKLAEGEEKEEVSV